MRKYLIPLVLGAAVLSGSLYVGISEVSESQPISEPQPPDPCAGLSDQECMELMSQKRADIEAKEIAWIEETQKGLDLYSLPRSGLGSHLQFLDLAPTLEDAVAKADLVVLARSESVHFIPFINAEVTLTVEEVLKGKPASNSLIIIQGGRLVPEYNDSVDPQDWTVKELGYSEGGPLLLPGEKAVLFLEPLSDGKYSVQQFTGQYAVGADDKLSALPGNPIAAAADGKPLDEFLGAVNEAAAKPEAP